jgi:stage II sporulation protein M
MASKKRGKNKFSLKEQYSLSWKFIKESKNFIFLALGIFFAFAIIGFFIPAPDFISKIVSDYVKEIVKETSGLSLPQLISFIFFNNTKSSFFGLALGTFFGVFPMIFSIFNGYLLGFVAAESVKVNGIIILWKLLPHGIFELPAVFVSLGLGIKLGFRILDKKNLKRNFIESSRVFLLVIIPLLLIAAVIEGLLITFVN